MDLREALDSIAVIRRQVNSAGVFRGYRSIAVVVSALLAVIAGAVQPLVLPRPMEAVPAYVAYWSTVAFLSIATAGLAMALHDRVAGPSPTRPLTWVVVGQFAPSLLGAAAISVVIVRIAPEAGWLLPGLWLVFFSQGIFASCRFLTRPCYGIAAYYLAAGIVTLLVAREADALAPWAMAVPFGAGQLLSSAVLYWTLERTHGREKVRGR